MTDQNARAWRLVPVEPTEAMVQAGADEADATNPYRQDVAGNKWSAMLTAAPSPHPADEGRARLQTLVDADRDHFVARGEDLLWLVEQSLRWPERVHPERTTNDRFLRFSMAATLLDLLDFAGSSANAGEGVQAALDGYRAAVSFIGADSWDGCSDCIDILQAARTADLHWDWANDPDRVAAELARIRPFARHTTKPTPSEPGAVREAVVAQLVEEGRAKHRVLNDEQQDAADAEARAFYRKVIDRYIAALPASAAGEDRV